MTSGQAKSTAYGSASEVTAWLRQRIDEAFADPRPNPLARDVFKRLHKHHAAQVKVAPNEKA